MSQFFFPFWVHICTDTRELYIYPRTQRGQLHTNISSGRLLPLRQPPFVNSQVILGQGYKRHTHFNPFGDVIFWFVVRLQLLTSSWSIFIRSYYHHRRQDGSISVVSLLLSLGGPWLFRDSYGTYITKKTATGFVTYGNPRQTVRRSAVRVHRLSENWSTTRWWCRG
jgi:hypothetical protein